MHVREQPEPEGLILTVHVAQWLKSLVFTVLGFCSRCRQQAKRYKLQRTQQIALVTSAPNLKTRNYIFPQTENLTLFPSEADVFWSRKKALAAKSHFCVRHASRLESLRGQVMKEQVAEDKRHWMQSSHSSAVAENHRLTNKQNNKPHQCDSYTWRENEFTKFDKGQQGAFTVDRYNQGICHRFRK